MYRESKFGVELDHGAYCPTAYQIAAATKRIRDKWTKFEKKKRLMYPVLHVELLNITFPIRHNGRHWHYGDENP